MAGADGGVPAGRPLRVIQPAGRRPPPLRPYLEAMWRRRHLAVEMARAELRSRNVGTVFGDLWLVLNPLLLALVYLLLVTVLGRSAEPPVQRFAHLVGGLFAFHYTRNAVQLAAGSITGSGRMVLNVALPTALFPLSDLLAAMLMYVPMLAVYALIHVAAGLPVGPHLLWLVPVVLVQTVFSLGLGLLLAALAVSFRDLASLLPYALRLWVYVSPVLFTVSQARARLPREAFTIFELNPLTPILGAWNTVLSGTGGGFTPGVATLAAGTAWAAASLGLGAWFFLSRERDFALRL